MPKRVIDFDAMWGSDKLAACAPWAQAEYAWLYGLADASGCFELTNLRVIWGRVAAIRWNFTIERLEQVFAEFQDKGLLFVWEHEGKRYAHWTGSDVPGRLPPPSWRMRLEKFAPPVPKQQLAEYMSRFARGRAALAGVGFRGEAPQESANRRADLRYEISDLKVETECGRRAAVAQFTDQRLLVADSDEDRRHQNFNLRENRGSRERFGNSQCDEMQTTAGVGGRDQMAQVHREIAEGSGLKDHLEGTQAQDLGLDWNLNRNLGVERGERRDGPANTQACSTVGNRDKDLTRTDFYESNSQSNSIAQGMSPKELAVARELRLGQGPVCGPARVKPEVLERIRKREAARAGSRSP